MTHAEQLERETEQARADIAGTLDELRALMTPGHMLDHLADRMNAGAPAAFARNLREQTVNNPLPVALISTGLAWLMMSRRGDATARTTSEPAAEATDTINDKAGSVAEGMQRTLQSCSALVDFCREQPLVLAGVGLAMGAIIGALLPASDAEDRLMGETSDRAKQRTRDIASQQVEAARASAKQAADWKDDAKEGPPESGTDEPTLAPKGPDESKGQPWSPENAPL
ncbi:MAG TPA: DUF3618 domain-containing protein [Bradyrhizobium sp.]|nr:DUF3618 domain-containing protein [Bradyrhizobium sp.]